MYNKSAAVSSACQVGRSLQAGWHLSMDAALCATICGLSQIMYVLQQRSPTIEVQAHLLLCYGIAISIMKPAAIHVLPVQACRVYCQWR